MRFHSNVNSQSLKLHPQQPQQNFILQSIKPNKINFLFFLPSQSPSILRLYTVFFFLKETYILYSYIEITYIINNASFYCIYKNNSYIDIYYRLDLINHQAEDQFRSPFFLDCIVLYQVSSIIFVTCNNLCHNRAKTKL